MKIYVICPVRNADPAVLEGVAEHVRSCEARGHDVHYPPRDVAQDCPTGVSICEAHRSAMLAADEVHLFWDVQSKGSHFDLGMAYALSKKLVPVSCFGGDTPGKSYWKVACASA